MKQPLISLCIPTKNRPENVRLTLESIRSEYMEPLEYQIVISDNSENDETLKMVQSFSDLNIKYVKNPVIGFMNSIKALQLGDGEFLKLQNDYSAFVPGGLRKLAECVEKARPNKTQALFTNGALRIAAGEKWSGSFDRFLFDSEYLNTWSTAYSVWKSDIDAAFASGDIKLNDLFPHTSLLMETHKKSFYCIFDVVIFDNQTVQKKGGYNIFYLFCDVYPKILSESVKRNVISSATYNHIVRKMKFKFVAKWYSHTIDDPVTRQTYTFDPTNALSYVQAQYGWLGKVQIVVAAKLFTLAKKFSRAISKV